MFRNTHEYKNVRFVDLFIKNRNEVRKFIRIMKIRRI